MSGFVRLVKTTKAKGSLIPVEHFTNRETLNSYLKEDPNSDWYSSLYVLGEEAKHLFDKTDSVAGYSGPAYCNNLVFDIDVKEDLEIARKSTVALLSRLAKEVGLGPDVKKYVRVYFSGNKGFHVFLKTERQFSPEELKYYCSTLAEGIEGFDTVVYNRTRLFRIVNTKHKESGLYKIPVSLELLKKSDASDRIRELAKTPIETEDKTEPLVDFSCIEKYVEFRNKHVNKKEKPKNVDEINGIRGLENVDFRLARNIPKCLYALSNGVMIPGKGERHHVFLHLANFYRNQGHSAEVVTGILKGISNLNAKLYPEHEPFSEEEIKTSVIKMAFSDQTKLNPGGWGVKPEDPIFVNYCKSIKSEHKCPIHDKKNQKTIVNIEYVADEFATFAANFEDNVLPIGIDFIDQHMKIATGTTSLLVGAGGSGKTSLCLSAMETANSNGLYSVFFSMDMNRNLVYQKLAQRVLGLSQDDIYAAYKNKDIKTIEKIKQAIHFHYKNTYMDFSGSLSLDDMKHRIETLEQDTGNKISLVIVDYASRMAGPYSDSHQNETYNAIKSKDIADETQAAWIILNQIARVSGDGSTPLRTKRVAKGSSAWEESATNQINIWRPFMGLHEQIDEESGYEFRDEYMRIFLAKNRMGKEIETVLRWDGYTGKVSDLNEEELLDYNKHVKPYERITYKFKK